MSAINFHRYQCLNGGFFCKKIFSDSCFAERGEVMARAVNGLGGDTSLYCVYVHYEWELNLKYDILWDPFAYSPAIGMIAVVGHGSMDRHIQ